MAFNNKTNKCFFNNVAATSLLVAASMLLFVVCSSPLSAMAQAPPLETPVPGFDPSNPATGLGEPCKADSDCKTDGSEFCRAGFCGAYVLENDWCGGFLPPESERRCSPGLTCTDFPSDPMLADGNGYCRRECSTSADCSGDSQYCAADGVCREDATCKSNADCSNPDNSWVSIDCVGAVSCSSGSCSKTCDAQQSKPVIKKPLVSSVVAKISDEVRLKSLEEAAAKQLQSVEGSSSSTAVRGLVRS